MTTVAQLAQESFVSLTTYRRSGAAVSTAVWVVPEGDGLQVWTVGTSGKVKRLRNNPRCELAACSRRGAVATDAERVTGRATIADDAGSLAAVQQALKAKYGVQYRVITTIEQVVATVKRQHAGRVVLTISPS